MAYMVTHSLLSSWLYSMKEDPYSDATMEDTSKEDFLRVLRREPTPATEAMQNGIEFEDMVTAMLTGQETNAKRSAWLEAARQVAGIVQDGKLQLVCRKYTQIAGLDLMLYGRLDAMKAGHIYDIKFSKGYERGKYFGSTQHPMYMELVPAALDFTYLVSNGTEVWTERYRRDETPPIEPIIRNFMEWLKAVGLMDIYLQHWGARP